MYPLAQEGFSGGSQVYLRALITQMLKRDHTVHVIAPDAQEPQQRGPREFWWTPTIHPHHYDLAIQQMHLHEPSYDAPTLVLMTSCIDPYCGPNHEWVGACEAVPVFSQTHKDLLLETRPFASESIHITGLGVDLATYMPTDNSTPFITAPKVPGRMLYANDPARGLFYVLDIFDEVRKRVPHATLHIAYDFDTQFSWRQWEHSQMAEYLWACKKRIAETPGVVNLGALTRHEIIKEQLECQVHCMPSDPPGRGTQTHGITQMECAAAGCALVLSDVEAFPEVFSTAALIMPTIGTYVENAQRRVSAQDYAGEVIELMLNPDAFHTASEQSIQLAKQHTWDHVGERCHTCSLR
jgi:glycosyltransferase involved in cell wall biosynthesis